MLEITSLSKSYNNGKVKAVNDISFHVKKGEIFGFLGPNGAGKTTTIKMIVGLLDADEGQIKVDGVDNKSNLLAAKSKFSYVPDNPEIYHKLKGIEYLNFIADIYGVNSKDRSERIQTYARLFEIEKDLGDYIDAYSHGMQQKLVLIGALLHDPEIFILDEPMVGLDPKSAFNLKELMRKRCDAGKSVFFSTHVLEVAEKICDRIAIINKGEIIAIGTMEEIRDMSKGSKSLEDIFLEITES